MLRSDPVKVRAWQDRTRTTALRKKSEESCGISGAGRLITRQGLRRSGSLAGRSPRKAARYAAVAEACRKALERDGYCCQAAHLVLGVSCAGPIDPHHLWPRWVAPERVADAGSILACCRAHHDWIGDHPAEARRVGLHGMSGDDPAALALLRRESAPGTPLTACEGLTGVTHYTPTSGGSEGATA